MDTTKLRRLLLTTALPAAGLVAAIGVAAAADGPRPTPVGSVDTSLVSGTATSAPGVTTVTSTPGDISGPCDEAEHAHDPRCTGAGATTGTTGTRAVTSPSSTSTSTPSTSTPSTTPSSTPPSSTPSTTVTSSPGDISGPCDEAEHANDPRCTGAGGDDDNSGPGSGGDDGDDDDDDDDNNSGPGSRNSGPGSGGDDDDKSGSGGGGDD